MSVLVCGGAGYIGSHTVHQLIKNGEVIMLDELDKGREAFYESYFIERSKK